MIQESIIPSIRQEIKRINIGFELRKDLQENEVVCEYCHGTGLEIADNIYGIRGDVTHVGIHFPYKQQSISFCKHCYSGVQKKCPQCGALRGRCVLECSCGYYSKKRREEWKRNNIKIWDKSEKISQNEAFEMFNCLYVDNMDRYVFCREDLEEVIYDYLMGLDSNYDISNLHIYGTTEDSININADSIVEDACEDLHEDSYDTCDINSLQILLDEWCKKQNGTKTYYPNFKIGIIADSLLLTKIENIFL